MPLALSLRLRRWLPASPALRLGLRATACLVLSAATGAASASMDPSSVDDAIARQPLQLSTFASGLESPWGMAFLPDGRLLVTERPGRLRLISADGGQVSDAIRGLPRLRRGNHGGLLDVAIDPRFESNRLVYFSYTASSAPFVPGKASSVTVARGRLREDATRIDRVRVLFRQKPAVAIDENLGGRIALSADGYLFLTIGDRYTADERVRAQDLVSHQGKTVRIRTDGSVPEDNPFVGRKGARPEIWSLGHRNPQGAFVDPDTGALWVAEHGPQGGDEVNVVQGGRNYGWPVVTFGCEYDTCAPIGEGVSKPGMEAPLTHWDRPGIAPSNLLMYTGDRFPEWRGNVFVGALAGRAVWRLEVSRADQAPRLMRREPLFMELGERIRDLRQGPDGGLYLLTDGGDARVVRVDRAVDASTDAY